MQTTMGALILIILGCVAVYGYLVESGSANAPRRPAPPARPEPAPEASGEPSPDAPPKAS